MLDDDTIKLDTKLNKEEFLTMSTQANQTRELIVDGTLKMANDTLNEIDRLIEETLSSNSQENRVAEVIDDEEFFDIIRTLHQLKKVKDENTKDSIQYINKQIASMNEIIENHNSDSSDDENLMILCTELSKNARNNIDTNFNDLSTLNSTLDEFLYSDILKEADISTQKQAHTIFDTTIANLSSAKQKHQDLSYLVDLMENFNMKEGNANG